MNCFFVFTTMSCIVCVFFSPSNWCIPKTGLKENFPVIHNLSCDMNRSIKRRPSIERVRTIFQLWLTYIQQQDYQQAP